MATLRLVFHRQAEALVDSGKRGGIMDAKDDPAAGPVKLITESGAVGAQSRQSEAGRGNWGGLAIL